MKNKLKFLVNMSLRRKIKTKWFVLANVIFALLIVGLFNVDTIINAFGGDFDDAQKVYVIDNSNEEYNTFDILKKQSEEYKNMTNNSDEAFDFKRTKKDAKEIIEDDKDAWVLVIDNDSENVIRAKLVSEGYASATEYAQITMIMNNVKSTLALAESNISASELAKISDPIELDREILDENKKNEAESTQMIMSTVFPLVILPFFALTIFLVQMVGAEVNDEKTTRGMEIIISNVSPKVHFFSKVIASILFVLIQGALLIAYAAIGIGIRTYSGSNNILGATSFDISSLLDGIVSSDVTSQLGYVIPLALVLMILTFIGYALLAGILASMTTNTEDFQQLQMPIVILSLVGYYLAMMAGVFDGSLFIKIFAFVPFISAILAPSLLILGQMGIFEFVIAIILMILTNYILIKYGLRIYKVGILNYSSKGLWKKMFKALRR